MSKGGSEEKNLPPSIKKLRDARKKGQLPKSKEMVSAAVSVVALLYVIGRGGSFVAIAGKSLDAAGDLAGDTWQDALPVLLPQLMAAAEGFVLPLLALLVMTALLTAIISNGGVSFASDPVTPKMERIDPVAGLGRLFSLRNLMEAIKIVTKLALVAVTAALLLRGSIQALVELPSCGVECMPSVTYALFRPLILFACLLFLVIGGLDLWLQRFLFRRDMRMTQSELKRDRLDTNGNPMIRQLHRREQQASMQKRIRTGMRNATFVIRSGDTALALRYAPPDTQVPVLVAKATNEGVAIMLEEARRFSLPELFDSETVEQLKARIQVGKLIPKDLFPSVIRCMRELGVL